MSEKPRKREWDAGRDVYGRPVTLINEIEGGKSAWSIKSHAISQRDEGEITRSLSLENLKAIAGIVGAER